MKNLRGALKEYADIVQGVRGEYSAEELTIGILRNDHPELDFMDNEEIQTIIDFANKLR